MTDKTLSQQTIQTGILIANVAELTAAVMYRVAGNDVSTAINGQSLTREAVHMLAISKLRDRITQDLRK